MAEYCPICGAFIQKGYVGRGEGRRRKPHVCPPRFYVEHPEERGEKLWRVRATSAEEAAIKYAYMLNDESGQMKNGVPVEVTVFSDPERSRPGRDLVVSVRENISVHVAER